MGDSNAKCDQCGDRAWFICDKCHTRLCGKCFERAGKLGSSGHFFGKDEIYCPRCAKLSTWTDIR